MNNQIKSDIIAKMLNTDEGKRRLRKSILKANDNIASNVQNSLSLRRTAAAMSHIMKSVDSNRILPIIDWPS